MMEPLGSLAEGVPHGHCGLDHRAGQPLTLGRGLPGAGKPLHHPLPAPAAEGEQAKAVWR